MVKVHHWFSVNGLSLNPTKSEAIVIGTGARQRSEGSIDEITVDNTIIQTSRSLGVIACLSPAQWLGLLDYRNSVLYGMSKPNIQKLQRIQNSLARIVTGTKRIEHISPVLARLHWLPLIMRVEYKVALMTFKCITTQQPDYLFDLVNFHTSAISLRSSTKVNPAC